MVIYLSHLLFFYAMARECLVSLLTQIRKVMRSFASDNNSGVHPAIMQALIDANKDHALAYGDDYFSELASKLFKQITDSSDAEVFFALNGTGANVIALQACTQSFNSIICATTAHIAVDECGAPSKFTGCALKEIATPDGKLTPQLVEPHLNGFGFEHHSQPKVIAISQCTELGTTYTIDEIKALADLAHHHDMYLFMDGARLANACVHEQVDIREMTTQCGVDIFTLGGAKNGLMFGEAVVSIRPELSKNMKYIRKQSTQLLSKMRYISSQFVAYFESNVWWKNAREANLMAQNLASTLEDFNIRITQEVQSNAVFFEMSDEVTEQLRQQFYFYDWDVQRNERRMVCSWDTSDNDIEELAKYLDKIQNH